MSVAVIFLGIVLGKHICGIGYAYSSAQFGDAYQRGDDEMMCITIGCMSYGVDGVPGGLWFMVFSFVGRSWLYVACLHSRS